MSKRSSNVKVVRIIRVNWLLFGDAASSKTQQTQDRGKQRPRVRDNKLVVGW